MKFLQTMMGKLPEFQTVEKALQRGAFPVEVSGLSVIHKAAVIAALCLRQKKHGVIVAPDESEAVRLSEDLTAMGVPTLFFPARDFNLRDTEGASHEYEHQRLQVLSRMASGNWGAVAVCPDAARSIPCRGRSSSVALWNLRPVRRSRRKKWWKP